MTGDKKNEKLVFEKYFPGYTFDYEAENLKGEFTHFDLNTIHNLASVTKSITSIIFGIAVDQGFFKNIEEKIFTFFPQNASLNDSLKSQMTLLHLLTMTSGLQWNENDVSYSERENDIIQLFIVPDPVHFILSKPVIYQPGSTFNYNGGVWNSKQIVSSQWITESIRPYVRFNSKAGYGYQWWIKDYELGNSSIHSIAAMG